MKQALVFIVALGVAASWLTGCSSPKKESAGQAPPPSDVASAHGGTEAGGSAPLPTEGRPPQGAMGGMPPGGMGEPPASGSSTTAAAGLTWALPAGWTVEAPRSMRVATYAIPAAQGDAEGAECAVFHFGAGQGGGVEANLERWIGQFQPGARSKRSVKKVNGVQVSLADVSGTYTAHGGSTTQPQSDQAGWRLLGAIAESPQGAVFFKLAGPAKTVAAASKGFDAMVESLMKE